MCDFYIWSKQYWLNWALLSFPLRFSVISPKDLKINLPKVWFCQLVLAGPSQYFGHISSHSPVLSNTLELLDLNLDTSRHLSGSAKNGSSSNVHQRLATNEVNPERFPYETVRPYSRYNHAYNQLQKTVLALIVSTQ